MATLNYTSVDKVVHLLQMEEVSSPGRPSREDIEDLILRSEDFLDEETHQTWKTAGVVITDEYHDYKIGGIKLLHVPIKSVQSVQLYTGTDFQTLYEGRDKDFIVDYQFGQIIFVSWFWHPTRYVRYGLPRIYGRFKNSIKVSYTHGNTFVPKTVEDACTKKAALDLIAASDYTDIFPTGTNMIDLATKAQIWRDDVDKFVRRYRRIISR
jgi:hypothetical protein